MTTSPPVAAAATAPFPRIFYLANSLELLERLAFYGVYINLAVYLASDVGMSDVAVGQLLGLFAVGRAWFPVAAGAVADRIGYRPSLLFAFAAYAIGYGLLYATPTLGFAYAALAAVSVGGAFLKPVVTGCVKRYSPPGRQAMGFAIFYATVNAGSVVGKTLARPVRMVLSLRATMLTSVIACLLALVVAAIFFVEPPPLDEPRTPTTPYRERATAAEYVRAVRNGRLVAFLIVVCGYYLLIEQFYQTFPLYMKRAFGDAVPREYITLINPLAITLLQIPVARLTRSLEPLTAVVIGVGTGAVSMALMGLVPSLAGACASFFVFALAEMVFSPRFYEYVASFAPRGREALYTSLALVPAGLGGLGGGLLSGRLIAAYLPQGGTLRPLAVWGTYAVIGVVCMLAVAAYRAVVLRKAHAIADV